MAFDIDAWARSPAGRRFQFFDPVLTYSKPDGDRFVAPTGLSGKELNPDTEALFLIGMEAFSRLADGETISDAEFKEGLASYWACIDEFRALIGEMHKLGELVVQNRSGQPVPFDVAEVDETQVVSICWRSYSGGGAVRYGKETLTLFRDVFLFHALLEIDNALIGIELDGRESVVAAIGAANALSNAIAIESGNDREQEIRRDMAYRGAIEKLKRDPKQAAKARVKECWAEWQRKPNNYKGKSAFAKDMMTKFEELDSQAVITRWCGQWEKEEAK